MKSNYKNRSCNRLPKSRMNKLSPSLLFILILFHCNPVEENLEKKDSPFEIQIDVSSAQSALAIARDIQNGLTPDDVKWKELFNSRGYKNYLIYGDSTIKMDLIKESLFTVFDITNTMKLDSLMSIPITLDRNFMKLALIQNFYGVKNNIDGIEKFLQETDFNKMLIQADSLAKAYLPKSARDTPTELYPVYVVVSDPDGRVMENSIILDLNLMYGLGIEGSIEFIAHEFHHNYRGNVVKAFDHPLMKELNRLHQEALADLIDKDKPPIEKIGLFPKSMINLYNQDYLNTSTKLRTLDSLVNNYLSKELPEEDFFNSIKGFFKFGGHTTGIYMSFLINEQIGKQSMINSYDSPVEFLAIYNDVAKELPNEYVFSEDFIKFVRELENNTRSVEQ